MEDLLSYRLSDLVLFSESTFYRQFELYNNWLGPYRITGYLYAACFLLALRGRSAAAVRLLLCTTAVLWLVCIYGFMQQYYESLTRLLRYFYPVMALQAGLLLWLALRISLKPPSQAALILWCLATLLALFELATGRPAAALSAYALTPDSLSIYNLALMFALPRPAWFLAPSLAWLAYSALNYFAVDSHMAANLVLVLAVCAMLMLTDRYRNR